MQIANQTKNVLDARDAYLCSAESASVLTTDPDGWFCRDAVRELERVANGDGKRKDAFADIYECEPRLPHYGFRSWDDFFTRRFRAGVRPVASPDTAAGIAGSHGVIVNPCEAAPYRLARGIGLRDRFWVKEQWHSIIDLLAHDERTGFFEGGTIYQAYLDTLSHHRWHSPVSGTIVRVSMQAGTYFSKALHEGFGNGNGSLITSQAYLARKWPRER